MTPTADRIAKGLWWDRAWRIVEGCTPVSEGCANCWSASQAHIRSKQSNAKIAESFGGVTTPDGNWNGHVKLLYDNLIMPLKRQKPTVYACWNDLFHKDVSDEFIDRALAIMALCPEHTFMVLTKRPERMRRYFNGITMQRFCEASPNGMTIEEVADLRSHLSNNWPIPNVWLGVTAENQEQADKRIPLLLQTPAAKRFVSVEPMLGPVDLWAVKDGSWYDHEGATRYNAITGTAWWGNDGSHGLGGGPHLDFVICGGESGHNARPVHPDWVCSLRDQCVNAGVPFWFKQWGEWVPSTHCPPAPDTGHYAFLTDNKPGKICMVKVGKSKAGRLLDGQEWLQWPEVDKC